MTERGPASIFPGALGRYRLGAPLGSGSSGWVFRAADLDSGADVALKLFHPHITAQPGFARRLSAEVHLGQRVTSPHVLAIVDSGVVDGQAFIATPFIDGLSLAAVLQRDGALPIERAVPIVAAVSQALTALHAAGIVHRDVKPGNILLDQAGSVLLADLGIARDLADPTTLSTDFAGTLAYAAPEQGQGTAGPPADIFGLGATLRHALLGTPGAPTVLTPPGEREAELRRALAPIPGEIAKFVEACMATDPLGRPTAAEAEAALGRLRAGGHAGRVRHRRPPAIPRRLRNPLSAGVLAAGAAALALGAGVLLAGGGTSPAAACTIAPPAEPLVAPGGDSQVRLEWPIDPGCRPAGYRLSFSERNDIASVPIDQIRDHRPEPGANSMRVHAVVPKAGTLYYFWIEAYSFDNQSQRVGQFEGIAGEGCKNAPPPANLRLASATSSSLSVEWDSGGGCTAGFVVYYSMSPDIKSVGAGRRATDGLIDLGDKSTTSAEVSLLSPATEYHLWVFSYGPGDSQSLTAAGPLAARTTAR
ncbi:MAG: protein kinase domain-containing protein [Dehalococcoidia bacterium]